MATFNSTQVFELIGHMARAVDGGVPVQGMITAVVFAAPGAPVACSVLIGSDDQAQYFDLDEIELTFH